MAICLFRIPEANIKVNVVIFEITTKFGSQHILILKTKTLGRNYRMAM